MSSFQPSPTDPNAPLHPYYPLSASIPTWTPNTSTLPALLLSFSTATLTLLTLTTLLSYRTNPSLPLPSLLTTLWFALSSACHLLYESHYVLHFTTLPALQDILSQLHKEYALSDSRYLTQNTLVLSLETLTVLFWGPLSLMTAVAVVRGSAWRWPLQIIVSLAHLYGVSIYYATSAAEWWVNGLEYCRPEGLYFWVYFVGMNALWAVIPGCLIWQSCNEIVHAFARLQVLEKKRK